MQGSSNIWERTNILKSWTYICLVEVLLVNYRLSLDHKCQNLFYVWDLEKHSVEHKWCLSNCVHISRVTKISGATNILRASRYWFPTGFYSKWNTVLPQEVPNSVLSVRSSKLNTFTEAVVLKSFQTFQWCTNISARELIF